MLANQICKIESNEKSLNFEIEKMGSKIINRFIDKNLSSEQIEFLKLYYRIELGNTLLDDDKVISALNWDLKKYIETKNTTFKNFENAERELLSAKIINIRNCFSIDEYQIWSTKFDDNDAIVFVPYSKGELVAGPAPH